MVKYSIYLDDEEDASVSYQIFLEVKEGRINGLSIDNMFTKRDEKGYLRTIPKEKIRVYELSRGKRLDISEFRKAGKSRC